MIRLFLLATSLLFSDIDLSRHEKSLYSENGEDGVIAKLMQCIPKTNYYVDLGAADGELGSNTYLLRLQGWNGLLLDREYENPAKNLHKEFITAENINEMFEKYGVPDEFDLLSIDIHYNDYYVWKALDPDYRPSIVVIEYNAIHAPEERKIVKYRPFYSGDTTDYFGASILPLFELGRSKGYNLVYVDQSGTNLFFVREDLNLTFKDMNNVSKLYHPAEKKYNPDFKHRQYQ